MPVTNVNLEFLIDLKESSLKPNNFSEYLICEKNRDCVFLDLFDF